MNASFLLKGNFMKFRYLEPHEAGNEDLDLFVHCLMEIENTTFGCNYGISLDARAFEVNGADFSVLEVLGAAYPNYNSRSETITAASYDIMVPFVNERLTYSPQSHQLGDPNNEHLTDEVKARVCADYWGLLEACISQHDADVFQICLDPGIYHDYNSLPSWAIMWGFFFVIHNSKQDRCIVLYGAAGD